MTSFRCVCLQIKPLDSSESVIQCKHFKPLNCCEMKTDKIAIFILLELLLTLSHCFEIERILEFNGHKSGMYLVDNDNPANKSQTGISYMFQKINDQLAIHALFQYKYNVFAANITKNLLQNAIQSKLSKNGAKTKIDWKTFLEVELKSIGKRLMKPGLSDERAVSKTSAVIVIVDRNTVTQAHVGNARIISFAYDAQNAKTQLRIKNSGPPELKSMLGGKYFEPKNVGGNEVAEVTKLSDVRFIVMGTVFFWGADDDKVAQILFENKNNVRIAAHNVAKLIENLGMKENNAVIVIGLNPLASISVPIIRDNILNLDREQEKISVSAPNNNNNKKLRRKSLRCVA